VFMFWDMQTVGAWLWDVGALQLRLVSALCICDIVFGLVWFIFVGMQTVGAWMLDIGWQI
jgi:hypothetical protein